MDTTIPQTAKVTPVNCTMLAWAEIPVELQDIPFFPGRFEQRRLLLSE